MPSEVRVSVAMTAFDQERWVGAAIESVLAQRTAFPVELVIGEDASTDRTPEIVARYAAAHPGRIRAAHRPGNLGMIRNFVETVGDCRGEFVAILEGDDLWTGPDKLQAQVDAMESHPAWSACFHRTRLFHEEGGEADAFHPARSPGESVTLAEVIRENPIATCSVLYRRLLQPEMPAWMNDVALGDWPLWILLASRGPIGYLDAELAAVRCHPESHWTCRSAWYRTRRTVDMLSTASGHLDPSLGPLFEGSIRRHVWSALRTQARGSDRSDLAALTARLREGRGPSGLPRLRRALLRTALAHPEASGAVARACDALVRRIRPIAR